MIEDPRKNPGQAAGDGETRREFLTQVALSAAAVPLVGVATADGKVATSQATRPAAVDVAAKFDVNGKAYALAIDPRSTLLDALRERLGLPGTKKGCDHGACGACTVLVDGRRVNSCLTLALSVEGKPITTIEGLGTAENLHPMQAAFVEHDGFQCGYCTPGQICSAVGLLREGTPKTDAEIREGMAGNLCRCGAYVNIVAAIRDVIEHQPA